MPEIVTKYPNVVLTILNDGGAQCGKGSKQNILKECPADRFCSLPTGELCIYGLKDSHKMTQISKTDLTPIANDYVNIFHPSVYILLVLAFGLGFITKIFLGNR